jgi:hypothetical protein
MEEVKEMAVMYVRVPKKMHDTILTLAAREDMTISATVKRMLKYALAAIEREEDIL